MRCRGLRSRLQHVRAVVEDRTAIGLGPIQSGSGEPGLPILVVRAQQRVAREIGRTLRKLAARKPRIAHDDEALVEQPLGRHARPVAQAVAHRAVAVVAREVDVVARRAHVEVGARVRRREARHARQQPACGERRRHADAQQARVAALRQFRDGGGQVAEYCAHALRKALAFIGEADAASGAGDEVDADLFLEQLDLVTDRAVREVQRLGGAREAAFARGGVEGAKRLHGGDAHFSNMSKPFTYCAKTNRLWRPVAQP